MASEKDACVNVSDEIGEKEPKMKCCATKDVSVYVCINCLSMFHKSCLKRCPYIKVINENRVVCCQNISSNKLTETQVDKIMMENNYLKQLINEMQDKNNILKVNNGLLLDKIKFLENNSKHTNEKNRSGMLAQTKNREQTMKIAIQSTSADNVGKEDPPKHKNFEDHASSSHQQRAPEKERESAPTALSYKTALTSRVENSRDEHEGENFQLVTHSRRRIKKNIGTGQAAGKDTNGFAGAERKVWIQLYRVKRHTESSNILEFIKGKANFGNMDIRVTEIPTEERRLKSFLVTAPISRMEEMYNPNFWPSGVGITRFNFRRHSEFLKQQGGDFL